MSIGDLTKQLAQQALLTGATKEPAPAPQPQTESVASAILNELARMQKALKEDEELAVYFQHGADRIRVMEVFMPSRSVLVLTGFDAARERTRVIAAAESLQLVTKMMKVAAGAKASRIALSARKGE